ncbi:Sensor of ECF-type sigma factor [Chitinophaga sp. 180180018-2]|nr:Sensor of ECF-type sigma factor [Chitinophaga sp. 212800010-3]
MKRISFIWIVTLVLLTINRVSSAQQPPSDDAAEKIKAIQIQYLTNKLALTPEEAQKFWPVYNNYTREVEQLIAERHQKKNQDQLSTDNADDAARRSMDKELNYEKRMLDIRSHYNSEFQKVLPGRKAGMVFKSEREFRNIMINHLNTQRMYRMGQGGGVRRRP